MAEQLIPLEVWPQQITQASIPANNNALKIEAMNRPAINRQNSPPSSANENDLYIAGDTPSGLWSSFDADDIIIYKGSGWLAFKPFIGLIKVINNDASMFTSSGWLVFASSPNAEPWTYINLTENFLNQTITFEPFANFDCEENTKYKIEIFGAFKTTNAGCGIGLRTLGPAGTEYVGVIQGMTAATTNGFMLQNTELTPTGATSSAVGANVNSPFKAEFILKTGATAGQISLLMRSEVASANLEILKDLTEIRYRKI